MTEVQPVSVHTVCVAHPPFTYSRAPCAFVAWRPGLDQATAAGICSEGYGSRGDSAGAVPDGVSAIRYRFDEGEPPAVVFSEQAAPGALVSWAWCQLKALDALLAAVLEKSSGRDDEPDVAGAVRTVLVPVIGALKFSERRAAELQEVQIAPSARERKSVVRRRRKAKA